MNAAQSYAISLGKKGAKSSRYWEFYIREARGIVSAVLYALYIIIKIFKYRKGRLVLKKINQVYLLLNIKDIMISDLFVIYTMHRILNYVQLPIANTVKGG